MPHLILIGGGTCADMAPALRLLIEQCPQNGQILFLPHAIFLDSYSEYSEYMYQCFEPFGLDRDRFIVWTDLCDRTMNDLKSISVIFLGGGNTYALMHAIRASGFDELLRTYISEGRLVAGNSAGALVLGKDIRYAHDPNLVGLTTFEGFDFVGGHAVWCHYSGEQHDVEILEYMRLTGAPVIALPIVCGAHLRDGHLRAIGIQPLEIFTPRGRMPLAAGQSLTIN